ncbi:unnamed protein product [Urochloa decumbens]|uniref:BTB domain-containing protein n=1 Tax=Urochloa decumbens TaxID=240449 RepID=A0ABC9BYU1_9POAL
MIITPRRLAPRDLDPSSIMEAKGSTTLELCGVLRYHPAAVADEPQPPQLSFPAWMFCSPVFTTGGYYWSVRLLPADMPHGVIDRFSTSLQLMSRGATRVMASHELSVLDPNAILPPKPLFRTPPRHFAFDRDHNDVVKISLQDQCLEYVRGGRLLFQCTVTVFPPEDTTPGASAQIVMPPSDMLGRLGEVLETGDGADVTFSVEGELFPAHKVILAMRSPVFKAELYGEMRENGAAHAIVIDDMRPGTFRALLRYFYTDASPTIISGDDDSEDEGDDSEHDIRVWELLTAADRYDVQRLKLICERILCTRLHIVNVADTLALADQHHCDTLKDACIEFMTTSQRMGQVAGTHGYMQLKIFHPHLLFQVLEKSSNFQRHVE